MLCCVELEELKCELIRKDDCLKTCAVIHGCEIHEPTC